MFFGKILNPGQTFKFEDTEQGQGDIISITNVVLTPNSKQPTSLFIKKGNEQFLIATLTKEHSLAVVNVFISIIDQVSLVTKGKGTLHITGFYEQDQENKDVPNLEDQNQNQEDQQGQDSQEEIEVNKDEQEQGQQQEDEQEGQEQDSLEKEKAIPAKVHSPVQKAQIKSKHSQIQPKVIQDKKSLNPIPSAQKEAGEQEDQDILDDDEQQNEDVDQDLDNIEDEQEDDEDDLEDDDEDEEQVSQIEEAPPQKYIKHDSKPQGVKYQENQTKHSIQQGNKHTNLSKNERAKSQLNQSQRGNSHQGGKSYNNNQGSNKHANNNNVKEGDKKSRENEENKNFNKNKFQKH